MTKQNLNRPIHEIQHGVKLAHGDPELTWGWGTPAGKLRSRRRASLIASGAGLRAGMNVLEIGCGTGLFTQILAGTGANILAVDISPDLIELAKKKGLPDGQVRFLVKRFEDCAEEGPFDAIVGSSVLHHLEIEPAVRKMYELLKPGGMISFAEPNMLNPQVFIERHVPWVKERLGVSPDETAFVRWSFKKLLERNGFQQVKIQPFDWLHPYLPESLIKPTEGLRNLLERLPGVREFSGSLIITGVRPGASKS